MNTILVPTDFTPTSKTAAAYAAELCKEFKATLVLAHVYMLPVPVSEMPSVFISADEMQSVNEDAVKKEAKALFEAYGIEVEWTVRLGMPADEIREVEKEKKVDLVVMGMKGSPEYDALMGSTTIAIIRKCHKPVLMVPLNFFYSAPKLIAYATDFSYLANLECFNVLRLLAAHYQANLEVVNVLMAGKSTNAKDLPGKVKLEPVLEGINHTYLSVNAVDIEQGLQQFITERSPDMLVMVAHKHSFFERLFHAGHTKNMVHRSNIPLLILQDAD